MALNRLIFLFFFQVMALYETACLLEHSCIPNVRMNFDKKFNVSRQSTLQLHR